MRYRRKLRRENPGALPIPTMTPADEHRFAAESWSAARSVAATLFVVTYLGSVLTAGVVNDFTRVEGRESLGWLALPVTGPFIAGATLGPSFDDSHRAALHADGIVQTLFAALFIGAAMGRHHELDLADKAEEAAKKHALTITPVVLPSGGGVGLGGSF